MARPRDALLSRDRRPAKYPLLIRWRQTTTPGDRGPACRRLVGTLTPSWAIHARQDWRAAIAFSRTLGGLFDT